MLFEKMVKQDNAKIGVGAVAVAGTLVLAYVLYKQWRKRRDDEIFADDEPGSDDVLRRSGGRGRSRNGRYVSDPGRVMPVPSNTPKEGIYKRHSSGAKLSQIPVPVESGTKYSESEKKVTEAAKLVEPDVIPEAAKKLQKEQPKKKGKDERYEDAVEKKKTKITSSSPGHTSGSTQSSVTPEGPLPVPVNSGEETLLSEESQSSQQVSVLSEATKRSVTAETPLSAVETQVTESSSPLKTLGEAGAGEAMAMPDPSAMLVGDSESSDVGAGDTLADEVATKGTIGLSPSSSVTSSPAKSPAKSSETIVESCKDEGKSLSEDLNSDKAKPVSDDSTSVEAKLVSEDSTFYEAKPKSEDLTFGKDKPVSDDSAADTSKETKHTEALSVESKLDPEQITRAMLQVQKSPNVVDKKNIKILVELLKVKDERLLVAALESIVRCGAFSANQKLLRENKCPEELVRLIHCHSEALLSGKTTSDSILVSINNAIMNLSMDVANQAKMESCIPVLIDLVMHEGMTSNIKLSALQPLTNLSTTTNYHGQYTRAIQQLYLLLDTGNRVVRIQALKLLVNLSCNSEMVRNMLAAKAPACMMSLLEKTSDPHLTLRLVTLLANIAGTVEKEEVTSSSLPPDEKAASPETMYSALFSVDKLSQLRSKVYPLTRHDSEDISQHAARLYNSLPNC